MNRRKFTKNSTLGALSLSVMGLGCNGAKRLSLPSTANESFEPFFKLSLAQWSLHKPMLSGDMSPYDFAAKASDLGFEGLEYVIGLFSRSYTEVPHLLSAIKKMSGRLLMNAKKHQMESLIIMVDGEGDLGIQDKAKRIEGVLNHYKWIDMAQYIGCHSIRVNLFGDGSYDHQADAAADSMARLADYAKDLDISIIVENHGGLSSDPKWLREVLNSVNRSNIGTLPDFGNFCIEREGGQRWNAPCINEYSDIYKGVKLMMPYAKGVSAKSYAFDTEGNETRIDFKRMLQVVKDAGYQGFIGVEYEGEDNPEKGILATKDLLLKAAANLD